MEIYYRCYVSGGDASGDCPRGREAEAEAEAEWKGKRKSVRRGGLGRVDRKADVKTKDANTETDAEGDGDKRVGKYGKAKHDGTIDDAQDGEPPEPAPTTKNYPAHRRDHHNLYRNESK